MINIQVPKLNESSQSKNEKCIKRFKDSNMNLNNKICLIVKEADNIQTTLKHLRGSLFMETTSGKREAFKQIDQNKLKDNEGNQTVAVESKKLMAEIRLPVIKGLNKDTSRTININLNSKEIKDILKCI